MSDASNVFEELILNVFFRGSSHTGGQLWVALYTAAPGETGGGTEPTGWYARQSPGATPSTAWADPSGTGITSNSAQLTWAAVTGSSSTIVACSVMTAVSGGSMWVYKVLGASVVYNVGDIPIILANGLQVQQQ